VLASEVSGRRAVAAVAAAAVLVCIDIENVGPTNANAFELQFDPKTDSLSEKRPVKAQVGDPDGWLTLKLDGTVWDMDAPGVAPTHDPEMFSAASLMAEPVPMDWNQIGADKSTITDTRTTLGVLDDRVRFTYREAVSSYMVPGANTANLTRTGLGFDNAAAAERIDATVWKTGSTAVSLFAEYNRVGANFLAPTFAIKPQDAFWTANSTTTRLGGALQQGPVTFTLEQRAQQSLAQVNAPTKVENLVGIALGLDQLWGRNSWVPEGLSWAVPASVYAAVGQGSVRATLSQGVNGDTLSDVSAGFLWSRNKVYASLSYWRSDYQSQLYPWQGLGVDGSVGYREDWWGIDLYFDVYRSVTSYPSGIQPTAGVQPLTSQRLDSIFGGLAFSGHF
jgi:hypothetical protein